MNENALPELGLEFGVNMFNEASPSPVRFIQNTSAVQVNNHSFNQPSAAINQPGERPECMQNTTTTNKQNCQLQEKQKQLWI